MAAAASAPATGWRELGERRLGHHRTPSRRPSRSAPCSRRRSSWASCLNSGQRARRSTRRCAVLVAGLGVLAIAYAISLFARQYQGAGAVYEYLRTARTPAIGIFTAGVFFVGTLFLGGGGIYLGLGILTTVLGRAHHDVDRAGLVAVRRCSSWRWCVVAELHRRAARDRGDAHLRRTLVHPDADPGAGDHRPGRREREHAADVQPQHHVGQHRLQRRDAGHPAVRRLRGGGIAGRGEPRPRTSRSRGRCSGTVGVSAVLLRDHVLRDLDRARQGGGRQGRMARSDGARQPGHPVHRHPGSPPSSTWS